MFTRGHLSLASTNEEHVSLTRLFPQDGASLEVTIWDGTFSGEECPPIQRYDSALAALQPLDKYNKHKSQKAGPPVNAVSVRLCRGGRGRPNLT